MRTTGMDFEVKYAWAEKDVSPVDGRSTDEWCDAFGVQKCGSLSELCDMYPIYLFTILFKIQYKELFLSFAS